MNKSMPEFQYPDAEWIFLQSHLVNIFTAFEPFSVLLEHADARRTPFTRSYVHHIWQPVHVEIEALLLWEQNMQNIGEPLLYHDIATGLHCQGEKWAVDIVMMRQEFNSLFEEQGVTQDTEKSSKGHDATFIRKARYLIGYDALWWNRLLDKTRGGRSMLVGHIHATQMMICNLDNNMVVDLE